MGRLTNVNERADSLAGFFVTLSSQKNADRGTQRIF